MSADLQPYFDEFIENITLGEPQVSRIDSATKTISDFLVDRYGIPAQDVFLQGSYANGTAVEPVEDGEYDVDIVCICASPTQTSNQALNQLEGLFQGDGRFRDRVKHKKPCVRLEYAEDDVGKFHVDVIPVRRSGTSSPPLEAPRRDEAWRGTAPAEYTEWCRAQGEAYARTVKAMKRWRDENQTVRKAIKSIVLQVLISECMPPEGDDQTRLAETLRELHQALGPLNKPPAVMNPVLDENLAERWSADSFREFTTELAKAVVLVEMAIATTDVIEASDAWRELLGSDFPLPSPSLLGIRLGDFRHAQSPAQKGWTENADSRFSVTVSATEQRGRAGKRRQYPSNGRLLFAGQKLWFKAHVRAPIHVEVWWQVANTGGHARQRNGLRGEIFKGKYLGGKLTTDESENWEDTAYTGSHLIRAMLVRSNQVVATSDWFQVNIFKQGTTFRL